MTRTSRDQAALGSIAAAERLLEREDARDQAEHRALEAQRLSELSRVSPDVPGDGGDDRAAAAAAAAAAADDDGGGDGADGADADDEHPLAFFRTPTR